MRKNYFVLACSLLLMAGGSLFSQAESHQAEQLASDFLGRLLDDGEDWDSALVQEMAAYLPEEQQKNWECNFKVTDWISPRWLIPFRKNKITEQAENLTAEQKETIYEKSTFSPVGAGFLNLGCGFGIGSFVEGDLFGGLVQIIPQTIAFFVLMDSTMKLAEAVSNEDDFESAKNASAMQGCLITYLVTRAVGFALPFVFSAVCNKTMQNSLGVDKKGRALPAKAKAVPAQNLSVMPLLNPVGNEYGFVAMLQL